MLKTNNLQHWLLNTPFGNRVLAKEELFYHTTVQNIFGYYALQIGMPQIDFLKNNKISAKYINGRNIKCDLPFLPFTANSIDLIVCPHTLESTDNYNYLLHECYRVLIPKGKLIITGFNPKSLLAIFSSQDKVINQIDFISLNYLKQQLATLNFNICGGKFFCYLPPFAKESYLSHLSFLDKVGDRWFPTFANCYAIVASKEIITPTLIKPSPKVNPTTAFSPAMGITGKITLYED